MNEIKIFENEKFGEIRTVTIDGEPWFVAKDVCNILGTTNPTVAMEGLEDFERAKFNLGRQGEANIINESAFYTLVLRSRKPIAKPFRIWVTNEVLPSIRKHGMYATEELLNNPDLLIAMANELKKERQARKLAEQEKELANRKIEEQRPLVDFANKVSDSSNLIDMGKMAKLLKDEHINIGRNRLFEWLRKKEILMKNNMPYQRYIEGGYFQVKESVYETPYGSKTQQTTYVTGKGQIYITEKLRKEFGAA